MTLHTCRVLTTFDWRLSGEINMFKDKLPCYTEKLLARYVDGQVFVEMDDSKFIQLLGCSAVEAAHISTQRTILLRQMPGFWDAKEFVNEYINTKEHFTACSKDWQLVVFLVMFFSALLTLIGLVGIVMGLGPAAWSMFIACSVVFFLPALIAFEATNTCETALAIAVKSPPEVRSDCVFVPLCSRGCVLARSSSSS